MSRVVWSPLAIARVAEAAEFIAQDKPDAAERWVDNVFGTVARLADFPHSGTVVPEFRRDEVRALGWGELPREMEASE